MIFKSIDNSDDKKNVLLDTENATGDNLLGFSQQRLYLNNSDISKILVVNMEKRVCYNNHNKPIDAKLLQPIIHGTHPFILSA